MQPWNILVSEQQGWDRYSKRAFAASPSESPPLQALFVNWLCDARTHDHQSTSSDTAAAEDIQLRPELIQSGSIDVLGKKRVSSIIKNTYIAKIDELKI